jgi:type I restriction enzyme S subunit
MLSRLTIPVPDWDTQVSIGKSLLDLDRKIELNRRMAATLEEMARAIFKSWFIDFDPVHAKAAGRPTHLPPEIDALFPDSFEDSGFGSIPRGWEMAKIKDLCDILVNGSTPSRGQAEYWEDGTIPWFRTGELSDGFLLEAGETITTAGHTRSSTKLLPRHSVVMAIYAAPTVGRLGITTRDATFNQAMTGMMAKSEIGPWFLFESLYQLRRWFNDRANGAAQQNISKAIVEEAPVVVPYDSLLAAFNSIAAPLYERREALEVQSKSLAEIRDTLLPKLISGGLIADSHLQEVNHGTN